MDKKEIELLIKYVMDRADQCYADDFPIDHIPEWILDFFEIDQPESSKREDCKCEFPVIHRNPDGSYPKLEPVICRCGALNSMET